MLLHIDGQEIIARQEMSLLDLLRELNLDKTSLSERPLAAKIAGEVFTLNYIPVRQSEGYSETALVRRAMAASAGQVKLLRYSDAAGREAYIRTGQFVIFLAMRQLWPEAVIKMNCTVGASVYLQVIGAKDFSVDVLKARVRTIVDEDIPLMRRRVPLADAIAHFTAKKEA